MAPNTIAVTNFHLRWYMCGPCWPKVDGSCLAAVHSANLLTGSQLNRPTRDGLVAKKAWPRNCSRNGCYSSRSVGYCNLLRPCCCCCKSCSVGCRWKRSAATSNYFRRLAGCSTTADHEQPKTNCSPNFDWL